MPAGDFEGPRYEVMYLFDAEDDGIPHLRTRLDSMGDSLVVVGGGGLWNVHVHTDSIGASIEARIEGRAAASDRCDRSGGTAAPPAPRDRGWWLLWRTARCR